MRNDEDLRVDDLGLCGSSLGGSAQVCRASDPIRAGPRRRAGPGRSEFACVRFSLVRR